MDVIPRNDSDSTNLESDPPCSAPTPIHCCSILHLSDILERIFDELMPPPGLLDPVLQAGPRSLWCRYLQMQKSLTLVCRDWNHVATHYLYQNISLRQAMQLPALVRTLRNNPDYHSMVTHLTFSFYVPDNWDQVTNDGISYLLTQCPNVRSLSFLSFFTAWLYKIRKDDLRAKRFKIFDDVMRSATSVTRISYSHPHCDNTKLRDLTSFHVFSSIPNITSFTLTMDRVHSSTWPSCLLVLTESHLEQIRTHPESFQDLPYLTNLDPKLTHLCVDAGIWFRDKTDKEKIKQFVLDIFGRLPDVHIVLNDNDWDSVKILLQSLPEDFAGHLDVYAPSPAAKPTVRHYADYRSRHPELFRSGVRFLHSYLRNLPNLPLVYPPEDTDVDVHIHRMFGMCLVRTPIHIFRHEEDWALLDEEAFGIDVSDSESSISEDLPHDTPPLDDPPGPELPVILLLCSTTRLLTILPFSMTRHPMT
ncbi:hypothetical protein QCA50_001489 [Cerrena zonata]|uniref:F-box domain-containing protein n=1 Tax=Cerrena zonata TaxID=2478898 RepID=A0AAW0GQW7_9APHY